MASRYAVASGNWSSTGTWSATDGGASGASVPGTGDDVFLTATSGAITVTLDANSLCRSLDCTGFPAGGTLAHTSPFNLSIGDGSGGKLVFSAAMTYTPQEASSRIVFQSTSNNGGAGWPITFAGKAVNNLQFNGAGGKWVLQDDVDCDSFQLSAGTLDTNGKAVSCHGTDGQFFISGSTTRSLTLGTSTITVSQTGWVATTTTNLTFSGASSTIICNGSNQTFAGGGLTYGTVRLTGTGTAIVTGANTFSILERSNAAAVTLRLPSSTTQTVTTLRMNGRSGFPVSLTASTAGTAATISVAAGTVTAENASIKDSTATGGASFVAVNSVSVSGNTGWTFTRRARSWGVAA